MGISNIEPESNEDRANVGPRFEHYVRAFRLYRGFVLENFPDAVRFHREANLGLYARRCG